MKKLLIERFKTLAGIKPLYINEQTSPATENALNPECAQNDSWLFSNLQITAGAPGDGSGSWFDISTINTVCNVLCEVGNNDFGGSEEQIEYTCGCCEEFNPNSQQLAAAPAPTEPEPEPETKSSKFDTWWQSLNDKAKSKIYTKNQR